MRIDGHKVRRDGLGENIDEAPHEGHSRRKRSWYHQMFEPLSLNIT